MFVRLNHQKLDVYQAARTFVLQTYRFNKPSPDEERFAIKSQIRRAALSVHLNIAEGCSIKSEAERKRYYEVARGSVVEIDAAFNIVQDLEYFKGHDTANPEKAIVACFKMLCGLL